MGCPKCQCNEISASGMCLWCGYQVNTPSEVSARKTQPQWRWELLQRIQSAKQKRKALRRSVLAKHKVFRSADSITPTPTQPGPAHAKTDLTVSSEAQGQTADDMTSEQPFSYPEASAKIDELFLQASASDYEKGWRVIPFRTLSGLLDLVVIALSSSALIVVAHLLFGENVLDLVSIINCSVLFLLMYFVYFLFFLGISDQTIGMMITNLHLVGAAHRQLPHVSRILARCCVYLVSLLCLGTGLLWALFDREHQCLHDRLTNTRVVRLRSFG